MSDTAGCFVLVGTPIGNLGDLSPRAVDVLRDADLIVAEDTRHSRKLLTHFGIPGGGRMISGHEHNEAARAAVVVDAVRSGKTVACVTDAGMPTISDPGARLVAACVAADCRVEVVPGPSAAVVGLALSGFVADRFVFEGFLPRKGKERRQRLAEVVGEPRAVVLFESPHHLAALIDDLVAAGAHDRPVAIARELTKLHESVWRGALGDARAADDVVRPRGEYVVVLGPITPIVATMSDASLADAVRERTQAGMSTRDAVSAVAEAFDVPRRRVYDIALRPGD